MIAFVVATNLASGAGFNPFKDLIKIKPPVNPSEPTQKDVQNIIDLTAKIAKPFESFTPEQEYYLGRAVGANIVSAYKVYENEAANRYVRTVGQGLATVSDRPETFNGYHFLILDSEEINAFAAPSGFIFVTRGMLGLCASEDELAAVLAHEIGHVQYNHAINAIKKGRITSALMETAGSAVHIQGDAQMVQLATAFRDSIGDITEQLIRGKYSRDQEEKADEASIRILRRIGYDPLALVRMLEKMDDHFSRTKMKTGFYKSHPDPSKRIKDIKKDKTLETAALPAMPEVRKMRFQNAMGNP